METKQIISWLYDKAARAQDHSYARMLNMTAKRLKELDEKQRWIPVTERLPKAFEHVLINAPGDKPFNTVHEAHLRKDRLWDTGLYRYDMEDITHWMPLPEPPKEEDHEPET